MSLERRVLFWMCVLVGVNQLGFGAMIPTMPLYAQSFGVAASAIGAAVAIYGLARFVVALPAGQLADRLGRRPTIALGGIISAIGNLWCAWATSYPEFMVARFVAGAGAGLIVTTGQVVLADISPPERRGRTIAIYQTTFIFAVSIGPLPGGLLAEQFSLSAPFTASGIASLLAAIVAWFAVTETRDFQRDGKAASAKIPRPPFLDQMRLLMSQIGYVLVSLLAFMTTVVRTGGMFAIIPLLAKEKLGISVSALGFAMMLGGIAGLLAGYPAGWLSDQFGRKAVILPAVLVNCGAMVLFCVAPSYSWFLAACIAWSVGISIGGAAPAAYAADSAPPGMNATALSTYRMTGDFGYVVGPLALGLMADLYGTASALLVSAACLMLVGLIFTVFAPETHRGRR